MGQEIPSWTYLNRSRSDNVTKVCVSVCSQSFYFGVLKHLEQYVSRVLQRCLLGVSWVSQRYHKGIQSELQGSFNGVLRVFQEYFKVVLWV